MEAGADTESTKQHSAEPWHAEAPSDAASKRPHLHHLDGFRTFATLAILLHHRMQRDDLTLEKSQGPIRGFQDGAGLGVAYYNLLTGFVTAIACGEREMGSSTARAAFLVRRMGRVSFSYYVALRSTGCCGWLSKALKRPLQTSSHGIPTRGWRC